MRGMTLVGPLPEFLRLAEFEAGFLIAYRRTCFDERAAACRRFDWG